jgi:hypothetical protein
MRICKPKKMSLYPRVSTSNELVVDRFPQPYCITLEQYSRAASLEFSIPYTNSIYHIHKPMSTIVEFRAGLLAEL